MDRVGLGSLLLSVLLPVGVTAQSPQPGPAAKPVAFEAADIHPSPFSFGAKYFHTAPFAGDRFVVHQATPMDLIARAYRVEPDAVTGGPPGLAFDRYDIVAKTPPGTAESDTRRMLQTLLADRFKLAVKMETRALPAFLLKADAGAKDKGSRNMKPAADPEGDSDCRVADPPPPNTPFPATITLRCTNMTMERFTEQLGGFGFAYLNHPVVDTTGLKGAWDFDLRFTWQPGAPDPITLFQAVEKLGLKLEAGLAPRTALAIASMAEVPTPNVPGIEKLLPPPPPPSFEVAVVRPSKDESRAVQWNVTGNQVTVRGTALGLIATAWDISQKTVVDYPAYADKQIWEVTAKLPIPDTPPTPGRRNPIDSDQVLLMLRSLLAERFELKAHLEDRPGSGYTLRAAGTPKLKKADPANRASCTDTPAPGEKIARAENPLLTHYMHCKNVTMDEFARELQAYSGYVIKTPVLNATGIEGRYDLTLSFTGLHQLELLGLAQGGATPPPGSAPVPGDPAGVLLLPDAVARQLGLKLELERRPMPSLVVDHIAEKPTEN